MWVVGFFSSSSCLYCLPLCKHMKELDNNLWVCGWEEEETFFFSLHCKKLRSLICELLQKWQLKMENCVGFSKREITDQTVIHYCFFAFNQNTSKPSSSCCCCCCCLIAENTHPVQGTFLQTMNANERVLTCWLTINKTGATWQRYKGFMKHLWVFGARVLNTFLHVPASLY